MCLINNTGIFAFIFDSGKLESMFYGEVVFRNMFKGMELSKNPLKMVISLGDIIIEKRHIDIEPYVIKDEYCTIDFDDLNNKNPFQDYPFCWIVEDLSADIAKSIDERLKSSLKGYVGLSRIDTTTTSERKQFWKKMIRSFVLFRETITCFQDPEQEGNFIYWECATEMGYTIEYDVEYSTIEDSTVLQSNYIKSEDDLKIIATTEKDIERDLLTLNFSLRHELQISGVLIWRAINDLDKVCFNIFDETNDHLIEYPFLALYHASQGIERIQKAIIELICKKNHIEEKEKEKVYSLLTSHSHSKLNEWIENQEGIKFNANCKKLINILVRFYNSVRYARYADEHCTETNAPEYQLLSELKNKHSSDINFDIKNNFGRCLGELSNTYFKIFYKLCCDLNIYAYELEDSSAAAIIYQHKDKSDNLFVELKRRQNAKKEVLYWLIKNAQNYPKYSYAIEQPLDFDTSQIEHYLWDIIYNPEDSQDYYNEIECLYDELCSEDKKKWKDRLELIEYIINDSY